MAPEGDKIRRSPDTGRLSPEASPVETGRAHFGRRTIAEDTGRSLLDDNPYETAQEFAERQGRSFMTFEQAKRSGNLIHNDRGNYEPAPGYQWVDDPAKREKHLRNWAVRKLDIDPKERARKKGLSFMTHSEAVGKDLIVRNAKSGNWEPAKNHEWVDYPKLSGNWAVRKKRPKAVPEPKPAPPRPKAPKRPDPIGETKLATPSGPKLGPKPGPKPAPKPHTYRSTGPLPPPIPEPDTTYAQYTARQEFLENRLLDLRDILENLNGELEELDHLQGYIYISDESGGRYRIIFLDDNHVEIGFEDLIRPETWTLATRPIDLSHKDEIVDTLLVLDTNLYFITPGTAESTLPVSPNPPEQVRAYNDQYRERAKIGIRIFLHDYYGAAKEGIKNWANAITHEIEAQGLPLTPQVITLVLTVISRESGFQTEPRVRNMLAMYDRLKQEVRSEHKILFRAAQFLLDDAEKKYRPKLAQVRTERDLEELAEEVLKDPLMEKVKNIPFYGDEIYAKIHDELSGVVGTVGSMQVNVKKAMEIAKREGRILTEKEIRDELYTLQGGLHYGIAMLAEGIRAYDPGNSGFDMTESQVKFVLTDYNGGLYTCRNAAIQAQLAGLTGTTLVPDGDLLIYDRNNRAKSDVSNTEEAFRRFVLQYNLGISDSEIRRQLLGEKSPDFALTPLYAAVRRKYQNKFPGKDLLSTITPQARTGHATKIKFGTNLLSTNIYYNRSIKAYRTNLRRIERFYA